jgi:capsule synthesis protein PGA_cap
MTHSLSLAVVGDVMLGRGVNRSIGERGFADPWGDLLPIIQNVDCFLINLECALTGHNRRWRDDGGKAFYFRAPPPVVETLRLARVDVAALANNHAGDYGMPGLLDTVHVLEAAGIAHAGAGPNLAAAQAPAVLRVGPWRIGVVAFADYPAAWAATPTAPGINYTPVSLASNDIVIHQLARIIALTLPLPPEPVDMAHESTTTGQLDGLAAEAALRAAGRRRETAADDCPTELRCGACGSRPLLPRQRGVARRPSVVEKPSSDSRGTAPPPIHRVVGLAADVLEAGDAAQRRRAPVGSLEADGTWGRHWFRTQRR